MVFLSTLLFASVVEAKKSVEKKALQKENYHSVWEKTYGGDDGDIAQGIAALDKGESALVGTCKSFGAKRTDICVSRMDSNGEIVWRVLLGGEKEEEAKAIIRTQDGNLMVLGSTKSFAQNYDRDLYVIKISLEGKVLWEKSFGGNRDEHSLEVLQQQMMGVCLLLVIVIRMVMDIKMSILPNLIKMEK